MTEKKNSAGPRGGSHSSASKSRDGARKPGPAAPRSKDAPSNREGKPGPDGPPKRKPSGAGRTYDRKPSGPGRARGDKPAYGGKPGGDKPAYGGKPRGDKPAYGGKPGGDRPSGRGPADKNRPYDRGPGGGDRPFERKPSGEDRTYVQGPSGEDGSGERRFVPGKRPHSGGRGQSLTQELIDLEYDIANLIARRTELLARAAKARTDKGLSVADPNQERSLRRAWDVVAGREGLDVTPLRGIFTLANGLAYAQATRPEVAKKPFYLSPHVGRLDLTLAGPRQLVRTRLLAALAAASGATCTLSPVVLNDPLVELVKALNSAGAGLSWEGTTVRCEGGAPAFADKTVFAGSDPLNMYLLLALALPQVGRMAFTGGAALKVHDLGPAAGVFTALGARLTSLEPYAPGLPARLESAGMKHDAVALPDEFPAEAALALAVAGCTFPQGLRLSWGPEYTGAALLGHAVAVLEACGVPCALTDGEFTVGRAVPNLPEAVTDAVLPLDALLSAVLLSMPRFVGGRVALAGAWPQGEPEAEAVAALLRATGLELEISSAGVAATAGAWPGDVDLDATRSELVPLAVALGLAAPGDARLSVAEDADTATAEIVAERSGRFARVKPGRIVLVAGRGPLSWADQERRFSSPSPLWTLALSLISLMAPNIGLANPGGLSELWPGYLSLFAADFKPKEKEPEEDDGRKKGRRVRIR